MKTALCRMLSILFAFLCVITAQAQEISSTNIYYSLLSTSPSSGTQNIYCLDTNRSSLLFQTKDSRLCDVHLSQRKPDGQPSIGFQERDCYDFEGEMYGMSQHVRAKHQFNERNDGFGIRIFPKCLLPNGTFLKFSRLTNSMYGISYAMGIGYDYPIFRSKELTVIFNGNIDYVRYDEPSNCRNILGLGCKDPRFFQGVGPVTGFSFLGNNGQAIDLYLLVPRPKHGVYLVGTSWAF